MKIQHKLPDIIAEKKTPEKFMLLSNDKTMYVENSRRNLNQLLTHDIYFKNRISVQHFIKTKKDYIYWYKSDTFNTKEKIKILPIRLKFNIPWFKIVKETII